MVRDLPHSPHLISPANALRSPILPWALAGFQFVLYDGETITVDQWLMPLFHHDPVLWLLLPDGADFETVVLFLRRDGPGIDWVHQNVLYH